MHDSNNKQQLIYRAILSKQFETFKLNTFYTKLIKNEFFMNFFQTYNMNSATACLNALPQSNNHSNHSLSLI